jgi:ribosome maturation factor RimP
LIINKIPYLWARIEIPGVGDGKVPHFYFVLLMDITDNITKLLEVKFQEEDFKDCFLVELVHQPKQNKLEVFIDADNSLSFERCQKISRFLEGPLDENKWLGERYILEVSSPGVERPLKYLRQYIKNKGRKVEVTLLDGKKVEGIMDDVSEEGIISVSYETKRKEGKKNIKETVIDKIDLKDIKATIVKITF